MEKRGIIRDLNSMLPVVFVPFVIVALLLAFFAGRRLHAMAGLAAGTAIGMLKTACFYKLIKGLVANKLTGKRGVGSLIMPYTATVITLVLMVILAIDIDLWAFTGVVAGLSTALVAAIVYGLKCDVNGGRV